MTGRPFSRSFELAGVRFEWDPGKNAANVAKHGFGFETAARAFGGPTLRRPDDRRDYSEERWIALGTIDDVVVAVVYTIRSGKVRIISARKANGNERKAHEEATARRRGRKGPEH